MTMRALVVYESMFGNTQAIARAVAEGLAIHADVELVEVSAAPPVVGDEVALLVVGGPTHAHGMTTPDTRADSARRAGDRLVSRGVGIREWISAIPATRAPGVAAAFDTRIKGPGFLWGSAAKGMAKLLEDAGHRLVVAPESFLVDGPTGPQFDRLREGELDRARAWAAELGSTVATTREPQPV
jgi:hypothetical protein